MLIGVVAETDPLETRVAASAETVKQFVGWARNSSSSTAPASAPA